MTGQRRVAPVWRRPAAAATRGCRAEPRRAGRPGRGCQVAIDYVRDEASVDISLGDAWRVSPDDDLIQILKDHYGNERVVLDY